MEIPYTVNARPDTGLWNAKVGVWLFLASEVMLFGGLFSSYIFLRLGADYNWPVGVLDAFWGCVNTLVLIASSVTIVMAWASLKMGKVMAYRIYLFITILCALGFMAIKTVEYKGKFEHFGVRLTDGTLLEGHFPKEGYRIEFEDVTKFTLELDGVYPESNPKDFLRDCTTPEAERKFLNAAGKEVILDEAGLNALRLEAKAQKKTSVELTSTKPLKFSIKRGAFGFIDPIYSYTAESIFFKDNTQTNGKLVKDSMTLEVDLADVRDCADAEKSLAWHYLGDEQKAKFIALRDEKLAAFKKSFGNKEDPYKSPHFKRHGLVLKVVGGAHAAAGHAKPEHGGAETDTTHAEHVASGHDHPSVVIEKKDITFWSNFTPKYNTYYAIYFALTSLHGLHVVAGALVLSYFLFFDGKLLRKDPEHMANRVEVGGLFWHFVDLVWIFLFPLLYLL